MVVVDYEGHCCVVVVDATAFIKPNGFKGLQTGLEGEEYPEE